MKYIVKITTRKAGKDDETTEAYLGATGFFPSIENANEYDGEWNALRAYMQHFNSGFDMDTCLKTIKIEVIKKPITKNNYENKK